MTTDETTSTKTTTGSKRGPKPAGTPRVPKAAKRRLIIDDAAMLADLDRLIAARAVQYGFSPTRAQVIYALVQQAMAASDVAAASAAARNAANAALSAT